MNTLKECQGNYTCCISKLMLASLHQDTGDPMLGDVIQVMTGNKVGWRVLPPDYQGTGVMLGAKTVEMGTYTAVARPDGTFFAECQGISIANEAVSSSGQVKGLVHPMAKG